MSRRVLVTGAGSGLGRAIAEEFAQRGDEVVATVRAAARAQELTDAAPSSLTCLPLELRDPDSVAALAARVCGDGGLDVLVHNAGAGVSSGRSRRSTRPRWRGSSRST